MFLGARKIPVMKPKVTILTDAAPGLAVSNFEVKFRDAELARLWNSDKRIRLNLRELTQQLGILLWMVLQLTGRFLRDMKA